MSIPIEETIVKAEVEGVSSAYDYAEWAVQVEELYGPCTRMTMSTMEECYEHAMGVWNSQKIIKI